MLVIRLDGYIYELFVNQIISQITDYCITENNPIKEKEITFLINSEGGEFGAFSTLRNILSTCKGVRIRTVNLGKAYGTAADIFLLGDERLVVGNPTFKFETPIIKSKTNTFTMSELNTFYQEFSKSYMDLIDIFAKKTLYKEDKIKSILNNEIFIGNAEEALRFKIATKEIRNINELSFLLEAEYIDEDEEL